MINSSDILHGKIPELDALLVGAESSGGKPFNPDEVLVRLRNMMEVRLKHVEAEKFIKAMKHKIRVAEPATIISAAPVMGSNLL